MKKVLITGASDGIGKAIALELAGDYELILCGRNEERLLEVAKACGGSIETHAFDLRDHTTMKTVTDGIDDIDVLINNAGVWHKVGDLETLSDETVEEVIGTNLVSQILLTKALLPKIRSKNGSAIVNVISKSGVTAQSGQAVYTASKYGMRGFTDVLRQDTEKDPVRVCAVYQSGTHTDMFAKAGEDFPVESFTEPSDLARVVRFMIEQPEKLTINEVRVDK